MKYLHIIKRDIAASIRVKFYFTGIPCGRGHYELRRVDNGSCLACLKVQQSIYHSKYYKENQEALKEKTKEYMLENRERYLSLMQKWRDNNPDYAKDHLARNRLKYRAYNSKRRSRLKAAEGNHTNTDIEELFISQEAVCPGCMGDLNELTFHVDHKQPISKGGSNWPDNLQLLCPECNLRKSDTDYEVWLSQVTNRLKLCT